MWFFGKKRRARKEAAKALEKEKAKVQEEEKVQAKAQKTQKVKEEKKSLEVTKEKELKKPTKSSIKKEEVIDEDDSTKDEKSSNKPAKYHVSQNKDKKSEFYKKWRVRKEGSQKTIKFYDTQLEAIKVAEDLADKAGSSIVIHKVDGSIRKQDYTKNEKDN